MQYKDALLAVIYNTTTAMVITKDFVHQWHVEPNKSSGTYRRTRQTNSRPITLDYGSLSRALYDYSYAVATRGYAVISCSEEALQYFKPDVKAYFTKKTKYQCPNCMGYRDRATDLGFCRHGHCKMCCDCWICGAEHIVRYSDTTRNFRVEPCCKRCQKHCECPKCQNCRRPVQKEIHCDRFAGCNKHVHHEECCEAPELLALDKIYMISPGLVFHDSQEFLTNRCKRFLSPEIEVAAYQFNASGLNKILSRWRDGVVYDGTVREGFEINPAPTNGDLFIKHMTEVCEELHSGVHAVINDSCGLHVHVDASDFTHHELEKLIGIYSLIEPALYSIIAPSRRTNRFCQQVKAKFKGLFDKLEARTRMQSKEKINEANLSFKLNLRRLLYNESRMTKVKLRDKRSSDAHYSGINLHSFFYIGSNNQRRKTIEFRMHEGSIDPVEIVNWAMLCGSILDAAMAWSPAEIVSLKAAESIDVLRAVVAGRTPSNNTYEVNSKRLLEYINARVDLFGAKPQKPAKKVSFTTDGRWTIDRATINLDEIFTLNDDAPVVRVANTAPRLRRARTTNNPQDEE